MQNFLVIIFPQLIDGLNAMHGLDNPRVKFWVAIITSVIGGALLNLPALQQALAHPTFENAGNFLAVIILVVAATQGLYLKYWENHPVRAKAFPTVSGVNTPVTQSTDSLPDATVETTAPDQSQLAQ